MGNQDNIKKPPKSQSSSVDPLEFCLTLDFWPLELTKLNIWIGFAKFYDYVNDAVDILDQCEQLSYLSPSYLLKLWIISFDKEAFCQKVEQEKFFLSEHCTQSPGIETTLKDLNQILEDLYFVSQINDKEVKKQLSILAVLGLGYQFNPFDLYRTLWHRPKEWMPGLYSSALFALIENGFKNDCQINIVDLIIEESLIRPFFAGSLWLANSTINTRDKQQYIKSSELERMKIISEYTNSYGRLITQLFLEWQLHSYSQRTKNAQGQIDRSFYIDLLQDIPYANHLINIDSRGMESKELACCLGLGMNIQKMLLIFANDYDEIHHKSLLIDKFKPVLL